MWYISLHACFLHTCLDEYQHIKTYRNILRDPKRLAFHFKQLIDLDTAELSASQKVDGWTDSSLALYSKF